MLNELTGFSNYFDKHSQVELPHSSRLKGKLFSTVPAFKTIALIDLETLYLFHLSMLFTNVKYIILEEFCYFIINPFSLFFI